VRTTAFAVRPWGRIGLRATAIGYLLLMIVVPLSAILANGLGEGIPTFWNDITSPVAISSMRLTLVTALLMTAVNAVMGTLTAYVLVRYDFRGRAVLNAVVDLPFAIPTLVTGVMLVILYGPQRMLGAFLHDRGVDVIFATPGIVLALLFVTYPFVIRTVQPVLLGAELRQEEAALTLGASKWWTFRKILLPTIAPVVGMGCLLSFARALGEFGSIVIVAGNIPNRTLTAPVFIYGQIESQNQGGASAMSSVLLLLSFALMLLVDWTQTRRRGTDDPS
jgi:sulfate transport system permease protein